LSDRAQRFFFTAAGSLRAPWRLLLFAGAFVAATIVAQALIAPLLLGAFAAIGLRESVAFYMEAIAALLATWFCLRVVEKKPWSDVGLDAAALHPSRLGLGFLAGSGAISVAIAVLILLGWLTKEPGTASGWAGPLFRMAVLMLPASLAEELIARGYAFTAIRDGAGTRWAVAITSAFFGAAHLANPGANAQSVILVALAGVFLAAVRIGTDSLYAAWAAHFAWNWVMAALFHAPVSGYAFEYPAYRYVDAGPDWATGGAWGPESGVPAGLMMLLGSAAVISYRRRLRESARPPAEPAAAAETDSR
jgi:membrane protease YdiL (CAAX protease family)